MPSYEVAGILVVSAAVALLLLLLSRLHILNPRNRAQTLGLFLTVHPVALLAWLDRDATLGLVVGFVLVGVVSLLVGGRRAVPHD